MEDKAFDVTDRHVILHVRDHICTSVRDLVQSNMFADMLNRYCRQLEKSRSPLLKVFPQDAGARVECDKIVELIRALAGITLDQAAGMLPWGSHLTRDENRRLVHEFVEGFYNYWRKFDRFMILHTEPGPSSLDQRPYRSFNATAENLNHIVRALYRDICENVTNDRPRVYRQVSAGCDVGMIAIPRETKLPDLYRGLLEPISFIRQVMIHPPMIIDPPMNTRTGQFQKVKENPLAGMRLDPNEWLCFPARVGPLTVFVYFHKMFMGLGCALANLFDLADDKEIAAGADAIFLYGAPPEHMKRFGELPTVFFDDEKNGLLAAAVPGEDRFGYFGYLKKMMLTLHNVVMMKRGRMPFHGAMVRITLKGDKSATFLIIGDTATGKSESLEALRSLSQDSLEEMRIIADDMGSLQIDPDGRLRGYGTEIGAFVRLDDLKQGYAFEQIDRAIFMSPQRVNARVVLPVTTMDDLLKGYHVDYLLYANNYEQVDETHPVLDVFDNEDKALATFREGAAMAKGTTTSTGLGHCYFANIFGAPQYKQLHEKLSREVFAAAFKSGVKVAQLRTRLGIPGYEATGPEYAAKALLEQIEAQVSAPTTTCAG